MKRMARSESVPRGKARDPGVFQRARYRTRSFATLIPTSESNELDRAIVIDYSLII
jgi:hypothetical protein